MCPLPLFKNPKTWHVGNGVYIGPFKDNKQENTLTLTRSQNLDTVMDKFSDDILKCSYT